MCEFNTLTLPDGKDPERMIEPKKQHHYWFNSLGFYSEENNDEGRTPHLAFVFQLQIAKKLSSYLRNSQRLVPTPRVVWRQHSGRSLKGCAPRYCHHLETHVACANPESQTSAYKLPDQSEKV